MSYWATLVGVGEHRQDGRFESRWRTAASASGARNKVAELSAYRIEIRPLWAPWAPAVSRVGGGVPGMNGWSKACAGGRALRRVTPCPTAVSAGIAASAGAGAAGAAVGAASDPRRGVVPTEVTGMGLLGGVVCGR
jgi:hypothetical protein